MIMVKVLTLSLILNLLLLNLFLTVDFCFVLYGNNYFWIHDTSHIFTSSCVSILYSLVYFNKVNYILWVKVCFVS